MYVRSLNQSRCTGDAMLMCRSAIGWRQDYTIQRWMVRLGEKNLLCPCLRVGMAYVEELVCAKTLSMTAVRLEERKEDPSSPRYF